MSSIHISISAETVAHIGSLAITNSMLTSILVSTLLVVLAAIVGSQLKKSGKISRAQAFFEMLIEGLYDFAHEMTGSRKKAALFLPLVLTFFLWISLNNWAGLLPGVGTIGFHEESIHEGKEEATEPVKGEESEKKVFVPYLRAGTADLNTTIALALISVASTQYFGFQALGITYLKKYFNFSNPINAFVGLLELVLEAAKIMSFAFRLFGNIFAGEVLLAVMMFLVPVVVPMPFYGLEIFVGLIQGVVFAMLSLVFFNLATHGHEEG